MFPNKGDTQKIWEILRIQEKYKTSGRVISVVFYETFTKRKLWFYTIKIDTSPQW